ncbi:MAG: VOC family protein [Actinomycetota bacterium]
MWMRLRQIAVVTEDLRQSALDIGAVLGVEACHIDPGVATFGLKNTLWPIGTQFLEVVTPFQDGTAGGRYLDRRGGDGGYMCICQVDDVERRRQRAAELGIRTAFELSDRESGHDGFQLHPGDTGGTFWEMDQMLGEAGDAEGGPWYPAGPAWEPFVRTDRVDGITAAEIQSPEPEPLAQRWSAMAEIDLEADPAGHPMLPLDNATIRFVEATDGRGEGLGGIDVSATDRDAVLRAAEERGCRTGDDRIDLLGLRVTLR